MNNEKLTGMAKWVSVAVIACSAGAANANGTRQPGITLTSLANGPAIHSYRGADSVEQDTLNPTITYVSLAAGPAIYSYPRAGRDTVTAFNVHYVDAAYGPAIYSYPYAKIAKPAYWLRLGGAR
ncbi:MAG: hypothetical protein PHU14_11995 [Methylovulum sp.]|nr:hypothetical protein [Methylovulum sp.]